MRWFVHEAGSEGSKQTSAKIRLSTVRKKAYQRGFGQTACLNQVTFSNTQAAGKLYKRDIAKQQNVQVQA